MPETTIASFIVRFTHEEPPDPTGRVWRGIIRHVQTNEQARFTRIEDALAFIAHYVEVVSDRPSQAEADDRDEFEER